MQIYTQLLTEYMLVIESIETGTKTPVVDGEEEVTFGHLPQLLGTEDRC